ncbi:mycothiol system anti-sigma-R factor [Cellulomonas hominis]
MSTWEEPAAHAATAQAEAEGGCSDAVNRMFAYLDSELEQPDAERVRAHLEECRPCLDELSVEAVMKQLVRRCCQEEAPVELRVRIREQLTLLRTFPA